MGEENLTQRSSLLKLVAPNRYELYLSFVLAFIGFCYTAYRPIGFYDSFKVILCWLLALVCVYNAILDRKRAHWVEHGFALLWFAVLLFFTLFFTWQFIHFPVPGPL